MLISLLGNNAGAQPLFTINPSEGVQLQIDAGSFFVDLKSNYPWVTSINWGGEEPWFYLDKDSSSGDELIEISYDFLFIDLPDESTGRAATITFTNEIGLTKTLLVSQFYFPTP